MGAWLELDWLPWDTVIGPWLPRALELAHAAVARWAQAAGRGDADEEEAAAAAAVLELLAGASSLAVSGSKSDVVFVEECYGYLSYPCRTTNRRGGAVERG